MLALGIDRGVVLVLHLQLVLRSKQNENEERYKEKWFLCIWCLKLVTGIGLAVVILTQAWTVLHTSDFFFFLRLSVPLKWR